MTDTLHNNVYDRRELFFSILVTDYLHKLKRNNYVHYYL